MNGQIQMKQTARRLRRALVFTFFSVLCGAAGAADNAQLAASASSAIAHASASSTLPVEQRVREELRAVMTELIETGAFGDKPSQQISLNVDTPAQRVSNLGLLVDSAHDHGDGLHVLAVTPGGGAERIGLRAGDVLVALNGSALSKDSGGAASLRNTVDTMPDGNPLAFDVRRGGNAMTLSGAPSNVYLPAMRLTIGAGTLLASNADASAASTIASAPAPGAEAGCGRVSDFDVSPRGRSLHAAKIISIDGVTPGPTGASSYRVKAGSHTLKVAENIEARYLSFNDRLRNAGTSESRYKTLKVDVAPDTTSLIAARLNEETRNESRNGAYWDPVAWKEIAESCR